MKPVKLDVHTHTIMSGHAFGTLDEMVRSAAQKGLEVYGITEHGPMMEGVLCKPIYYSCLDFVPREQYGMRLLLGCELNIIDDKGSVDLDKTHINKLDIRLAGIHANKIGRFNELGSVKYNTDAYMSVIMNPDIDIITHPDAVDADYDELCRAAMEHETFLEINNNSLRLLRIRPHAKENIVRLLKIAKELKMDVILGSDAHYMAGIGKMDMLEPLLAELEFPESQIINYRPQEFLEFIERKRSRRADTGR